MKNINYYVYYKPITFLKITKLLLPFLVFFTIIFLVASIYLSLYISPEDYEQSINYKIIYIHVPLAWFSISLYIFLAIFSLFFLIWKHPIFLLFTRVLSYIGIILTSLTLITGSFWGLPMWGTFWVWDARLTSVLILLFLYLVNFFLNLQVHNLKQLESAAILAVFGVINIPIIKYSVIWWNTLHQPASITGIKTTIHILMLVPIFTTTIFLGLFIFLIFVYKLRQYILENKFLILNKKNYDSR
jgi:heme exporter protein C